MDSCLRDFFVWFATGFWLPTGTGRPGWSGGPSSCHTEGEDTPTAPIVPGIMLVTNPAGLRRMAAMRGAAVPDWLIPLFDGTDDDAQIGIMVTAEQVRVLQATG